VDPVPDPLLLRKSGSAGDRTRNLCIRSQKLWPLDQRGGRNVHIVQQIHIRWWQYTQDNYNNTHGQPTTVTHKTKLATMHSSITKYKAKIANAYLQDLVTVSSSHCCETMLSTEVFNCRWTSWFGLQTTSFTGRSANRAVRLVERELVQSYEMFTREKTLFAPHVDINTGYVVNPPNGQLTNSITVVRYDNINIRSCSGTRPLANSNGLRMSQAASNYLRFIRD